MRAHLFVGIFSFCFWLHAQSSVSKEEALSKIVSLQAVNHDFYDDGLFPSLRFWFSGFGGEEDNTVFTTASLVYVLRQVQKSFPDDRITQVIDSATPTFEKYRSRRGRATYNYWQTTSPDLPFPNSSLLSRKRFRLPDDFDVTAIIQLAKGPNTLDTSVRMEMLDYATRPNRKQVTSFPDKYQGAKAYEVWFADKMEQEYDVVVMANVLLFVLEKGYEFSETDKATVNLIQQIVKDEAYFSKPRLISPYYRKPAVILYHLSRLVQADHDGILHIREDLGEHIFEELERVKSETEKLLLYSALAKIGFEVTPSLSAKKILDEIETFEFFAYQPKISFPGLIPKMTWRCEALNWALLLEFLTYYEDEIIWES